MTTFILSYLACALIAGIIMAKVEWGDSPEAQDFWATVGISLVWPFFILWAVILIIGLVCSTIAYGVHRFNHWFEKKDHKSYMRFIGDLDMFTEIPPFKKHSKKHRNAHLLEVDGFALEYIRKNKL